MDGLPPNPVDEPVKKPDPALAAEEEERWQAILADFDNDALHKEYVGFCLRNSLIVQASKRYTAYSENQQDFPLERRRKARYWSQQLHNVLFAKPVHGSTGSHREGIFGTMSYPEQIGVFLAVLLFLTGLFTGGWWLLLSLGSAGFLAYVFTTKYLSIRDRLRRD